MKKPAALKSGITTAASRGHLTADKKDHPAGRGERNPHPFEGIPLVFENVHRNDKPGQNKPDCQNGNLVIRHYKEKAVAYIEQRPFSIIRQGTRSNLSRLRTP